MLIYQKALLRSSCTKLLEKVKQKQNMWRLPLQFMRNDKNLNAVFFTIAASQQNGAFSIKEKESSNYLLATNRRFPQPSYSTPFSAYMFFDDAAPALPELITGGNDFNRDNVNDNKLSFSLTSHSVHAQMYQKSHTNMGTKTRARPITIDAYISKNIDSKKLVN